MDYSTFQRIAATQEWLTLLPEITLCGIALFLLLLDVMLPTRLNRWVPRIGIVLNLAVLAFVCCGTGTCPTEIEPKSVFNGMIVITPLSQWFRVFFLLSNIGILWLAGNYLRDRKLVRTEFYALSSIVTAAMMLLVHSNHFVILFVSLETIAVGLYVMVAYDRNSPLSLEAGIKYLVVGGTNTAILLLGIALLYGIGGNPMLVGSSADPLAFGNLQSFLAENAAHPVARMGALAVLASVAFKIGLVPFQIWIPDVYQGAPTPTTAFLSVSSKAAGVAVLLILFSPTGAFAPLAAFVSPILLLVTAVTLIYGNVVALGYTNLKRLLGMSGVAHAGFLMMGILVMLNTDSVSWVSGSILFYLFAYLLASLVVFGVMSILSIPEDADQDVYDYTQLGEQRPVLAALLTIGIGSLAGIPPLVGFMAKFSLFVAAFQSGLLVLLGIGAVSVAVSIYYYFKWIREIYVREQVVQLDDEEKPEPKVFASASMTNLLFLGLVSIAILVFGLFPMDLLSNWSLF